MAVLRAAQLFPQSPIREISVRAPTRWPVWGTHRWLQYIVNRTSSAVDVSNAEPCALNAARYNPSGCAGSLTPNKKLHRIKGSALRWPLFIGERCGRSPRSILGKQAKSKRPPCPVFSRVEKGATLGARADTTMRRPASPVTHAILTGIEGASIALASFCYGAHIHG